MAAIGWVQRTSALVLVAALGACAHDVTSPADGDEPQFAAQPRASL